MMVNGSRSLTSSFDVSYDDLLVICLVFSDGFVGLSFSFERIFVF